MAAVGNGQDRAGLGTPAPKAVPHDVELGLDVDITLKAVQRLYGMDGDWIAVGERKMRMLLRAGSGGGPTGTRVLLGPSSGSTLEVYRVPGAQPEATPARRRVGTLARFVAHLAKSGILRKGYSLESTGDRRVIQKCAHIAQGLGIRLGYEFILLENGAFSADLETDLCRLGEGRGGSDPLAGSARAAEALVRLTAGRPTEWLEVATFALHPESRWRTAGEFAARRGIIGYDRRTVRDAFDRVEGCLEELGVRG